MKSFQWIVSLTSSWSKSRSLGYKVTSLIEDMKDVFDSNGYIIPKSSIKVNSLVHHLGLILEKHIGVDNGISNNTIPRKF